ncbi:MAG: S-layer homology domain-containing protein [Oscillospiraceae bacterium]|nr:S-layer homology domain-containing protein [Oscillospiraceae bacterium]
MKKKLCAFVSVWLSVTLLLSSGAVATSVEPLLPEDVAANTSLFYHVRRGVQLGLIKGVCGESFRFAPHRNITRAEFITMLGRLYEHSHETIGTPGEGLFYERYLNWAVEMGVIRGNEDGDLMPHSYISSEQIVVIIYRYVTKVLGLTWDALQRPENHSPLNNLLTHFYTWPDISDWALAPAKALGEACFILPFRANFSPQRSALRAEALIVLVRLQNRMSLVLDESVAQTTETYFVERFNIFSFYSYPMRWAGFTFQLVDGIDVSLEGHNIWVLTPSTSIFQAPTLGDIIGFVEPEMILYVEPDHVIYLQRVGTSSPD